MRSLLATVQADSAKRAATEHVRAGAGSLSDVVRPLKEATEFVRDSLVKANATRRAQTCGTLCVVTIILDAVNIGLEASVAFDKTASKRTCALFTLVTWWVTGLLTLTVDQELPLSEAVHVLVQQFTSIGYGSATNEVTGIKLFHGLHGVLSQMSVARVTGEFINQFLSAGGSEPAQLFATFSIALAAATFWFAGDLGADKTAYPTYFDALIDGFYQALITMTTIGYGDLSPTAPWSKYLTPIGLPLLTTAFANFAGATVPGAESGGGGGESTPEICNCFGQDVCAPQ